MECGSFDLLVCVRGLKYIIQRDKAHASFRSTVWLDILFRLVCSFAIARQVENIIKIINLSSLPAIITSGNTFQC